MKSGLECLRCPGCGAPVYAGETKCRYCGKMHDWKTILSRLPDDYEVLFADEIPVEIVKRG